MDCQHDGKTASGAIGGEIHLSPGRLGTALLNTLYASAVTSYLATQVTGSSSGSVTGAATISGYHRAFLVGAAFLAAALVATAILVNAKRSELSEPENGTPAISH